MLLSIVIPILLAILVIVCLLLILVVLMQRPRSEGLGAAFGSGMTENLFGTDTTNVLTKATVYLGGTLFGVTLILTILTAQQCASRNRGVLEQELSKAAAVSPAASARPSSAAVIPAPSAAVSSAATSASSSASAARSAAASASATPQSSASASASPSANGSSSPAR